MSLWPPSSGRSLYRQLGVFTPAAWLKGESRLPPARCCLPKRSFRLPHQSQDRKKALGIHGARRACSPSSR